MEVSIGPRSVEQVRAFLSSVFPNLRVDHLSLLGEGWDSIAVLIDGRMVFRIPKRPVVARQMEREFRVLQAIRPYVRVHIPMIEWIGPAHGQLPISVIGYQKLNGTPLSNMKSGEKRSNVLKQIGRFLSELHAIPTGIVNGAETSWFRWTGDDSLHGPDNWETGLRRYTERIIQDVVPLLSLSLGRTVMEIIADFLGDPQHFQFQSVLLHGDLAQEHILLDSETDDISVIDFGDCGIGDPAYDVWPDLIPWYHGNVDATFQERQRFYRRMAPFHGVLHGLLMNDKTLVTNGLKQVGKEFANL